MKKIVLLLSGLCLATFIPKAQTTINDSTEVSGTWTKINSPYLINGLAYVQTGNTLIIEPGVEIRFKTGTDYSYIDKKADVGLLYVKGKLVAEGTSYQRITFTRQGESGNWGCIAFTPTADISSSLKYCKVEYANEITDLESRSYFGAVALKNPKISISHSEIKTNTGIGIHIDNSTPLIHNCIISDNGETGIFVWDVYNNKDTVYITNNTFIGNKEAGLSTLYFCKIVNNIFWNNKVSVNISSSSFASYNLVQEDDLFVSKLIIGEGMLYNYDPHLGSDFCPRYNSPVINAGTPDTSGLYLDGYDFEGNIRITQSRIDIGAIELDTPKFIWLSSPNGKEGFMAGSNHQICWQSNVENVKLEYTNNFGLTWIEINKNTENDGYYNWIIPSMESVYFTIRISDATDNSLFDICDRFFGVFTSNIPDNTNLSGRLTKEYSPYYFNGLVNVSHDDTLIIDPGVEIRLKTGRDNDFLNDNSVDVGLLHVKGSLVAEGTSNQKITFTRQGVYGNWGCIAISDLANKASFKYCRVEYADLIQNLADGYNGALSFKNRQGSITHSEIISNNNHGIYCDPMDILIQNCIIANNIADGIYIGSESNQDTLKIINNTIVGNGSIGLYDLWNAKSKIINNIFWNNAGSYDLYNNSFLSYNLVQENYKSWSSSKIGEGMIYNLDPQFVNSNNNNYHLEVTSPCIDAGDPGFNYDNESSDNGGRINIGAYGNTVEATKTEYIPRINYLSARTGRMFESDTLIIKGSNFLTSRGNGRVNFGNTESKEYLYWSEDSIVCITPPHLPEIININIVNNEAQKGYGKNCFSFLPPVLNTPDPVFSNSSGGQQIIFSGELFGHSRNGLQVLFDNIEAPVYHTWKDDTIILLCPSHEEGLIDLIFKLNDSIYYNFDESFLYSDKPLIELCGEISGTLSNSYTYLLTCPVTISENQTVQIEPGVLIIAQYDEDTLISITSNGVIEANGSKFDSIKIISFPQYKGYWEGIILKNQSFFNYCVIKNGVNGITMEGGSLELMNSAISNNLNAGLNLDGIENLQLNVDVENASFLNNAYGIYARAACNYNYGNITAILSSCNIFDNSETGIDLYSYGRTYGNFIPVSNSASINLTLKNSVISKSGNYAMKIRSYGFINTLYTPYAHRYGHVNFISENNIIFDNGYGIIAQRENDTRCIMNTRFYNTVIYNNNSLIEMDADNVFIYNSNLWDNGVSANPVGICDSMVVKNSNLNSLENIAYGTDNISINPNYISPESGDFHLSQGSPCIDAGSNQFVSFETDFDGKVRIWNATDKDSAIVDIGAFEFDAPEYIAAIDKEIGDIEMELFPNPAEKIIWIKSVSSNVPYTFELYNIKGQIIMKLEIHSELTSVGINNYDTGMYVYRIITKNRSVKYGKLIIN